MNRFYLLVWVLLLPTVSFAQKIGYTYDAAGNRIKREIIMSPARAMTKQQTSSPEKQVFSDMVHDHSVKIYPNPTDGFLRVSVSGLDGMAQCSVGVYTSQGALIQEQNLNTGNAEINISNYPVGIYLLRIGIDNKVSTWKVIKK